MRDFLQEIVAYKRRELAEMKDVLSYAQLHVRVEEKIGEGETLPSMRKALENDSFGIIAEFKRRSPSKGWINEGADAHVVPLAYQTNGAAASSILTDSHFFGGSDRYVVQARQAGLTIPVLYKNFVIDEYQVLQARLCGASAVLLIAACLDKSECRRLMDFAHQTGLEVLLEMHGENELDYVELQPDMCGINNRNLGSFVTDVENSFRIAERLPADACKVSESGISNPATVVQLQKAGFQGFLMGEHFMKTEAPGAALARFLEECRQQK